MEHEWVSERKVKDSLRTSNLHQINWNRLINLFSSFPLWLTFSFIFTFPSNGKKYDYQLNCNHFSKVKIELCNFKWHENEIVVISVSVFFPLPVYAVQLYNVWMIAQCSQQHYFAKCSLSICFISKCIENFLDSNGFLCSLINRLPHNAICTLA